MKTLLISILLFCTQPALAASMSPEDMTWLGGMSAYSKGDYATALQVWKPIAERGHTHASMGLGRMYRDGKGVPQDYKTAIKYYNTAVRNGSAEAMVNIGWFYYHGKGFTQNYHTATKWFTVAAERGNAPAQSRLGNSNEYGLGVPQNLTRAHMWYNLSASQRYKGAKKKRDKVAKKMTSSQIENAQMLASECVAKDYKGC